MIYIIGVDHLLQYDNGIVPAAVFREFTDFLEKAIRDFDISLVAEEFSEEALQQVYHANTATVKSVAERLGIGHRFCDPEETDRLRLGIPYFGDIRDKVREGYGIAKNTAEDFTLREKITAEASVISREYWALREDFWYERIRDALELNILFVCGHEHARRFADLVSDKGEGCLILEKFWGQGIFSDYDGLFI